MDKKPELEPVNAEPENGEWESPLERIRRQMGINKKNIQKQKININTDNNKPVQTNSLSKDLNNQKEMTFADELEAKFGSSTDKYARDAMSSQQKHDSYINKRRDSRWQQAVDNRPLWRKGSANDDLLNMDSYFGTEKDKYEDEYDDTYDELYEPGNNKNKIKF